MENTANCKTYHLIQKAQEGDSLAKERLVNDNTGLIYSVARKFLNRGYEMDDLFQLGAIGLIKAIENFNVDFEVKFSTYAVPMIMGEIKRFLRDDGPIKVSRNLKVVASKARMVQEELANQYGREPTVKEIAATLEIDPEELASALDASRSPESIYAPCGDNDKLLLLDKMSGGVNHENNIVNHIALREIIQKLPEREKKIILLRYFRDKTQTQVAKVLGISQVQVSRIEKKILLSMREKM